MLPQHRAVIRRRPRLCHRKGRPFLMFAPGPETAKPTPELHAWTLATPAGIRAVGTMNRNPKALLPEANLLGNRLEGFASCFPDSSTGDCGTCSTVSLVTQLISPGILVTGEPAEIRH